MHPCCWYSGRASLQYHIEEELLFFDDMLDTLLFFDDMLDALTAGLVSPGSIVRGLMFPPEEEEKHETPTAAVYNHYLRR